MDTIIPASTRRAALRGFTRTTSQALAGTIPTATVTGAVLSDADLATIGWAVGAAVLSSLLAGLASLLQITASGIPEDYMPAEAVAEPHEPDTAPGKHRDDDIERAGGAYWEGQ